MYSERQRRISPAPRPATSGRARFFACAAPTPTSMSLNPAPAQNDIGRFIFVRAERSNLSDPPGDCFGLPALRANGTEPRPRNDGPKSVQQSTRTDPYPTTSPRPVSTTPGSDEP